MKYNHPGLDLKSWSKQTMICSPYPKVWSFFVWDPLQNLLRSLDWWVFMTQMPFATMASITVANSGEHSLQVSSIWLVSRSAQLCQLRILTRKGRWSGLPRLPSERTSWEGITHQPTQYITYSSAKFDQAATCFQHLQLGLQLSMETMKMLQVSVRYNWLRPWSQ